MEEACDLNSKEFIEYLVSSKVLEWKTANACAAGDNMAGSVKNLTVQTIEGQKLDLIYKHIPAENCPDWIIEGQVYRNEHGFYRTIAPMLQEFSKSRGFSYKLPIPRYWKGFNNDKSDYILLQDVRPLGYKMPDKRISLTFPEMSLVLKELATFHAVSYAFLEYNGQQIFENIPEFKFLTQMPPPLEEDGRNIYDKLIQVYFNVGASLLAEKFPKIQSLVPSAWKIRSDYSQDTKYFQTIIHTDLWTNNLMIKYSPQGQPLSVKFIDFQFVHKGNVFSDLMYLIFTSTNAALRSSHLQEMLNIYHDSFSSTLLDSLKCPLPLGFTKGFLTEEFTKWHLIGLIHMSFAIPLQLGDFTGAVKDFSGDGMPDPMENPEAIKEMFLRSPIALQRFMELAQEMQKLNFI